MAIRLPGGRGWLQGQNADSLYNEQLRQRQAEQYSRSGWWLAPATPWGHHEAITFTANSVRFAPLEPLVRGVMLRWVRLSVTVGQASGTVQAALYRVDRSENLTIRQVPFTDVTFDASSAALVEQQLKKDVYIDPSQDIWLGVVTNDNTVEMAGVSASPARSVNLRFASSVSTLPAFARLENYTTSNTVAIPMVVYLSNEAQRVM